MDFEKDENFEVEIFEPSGGAKLGKINRTAVTITNDDGNDASTFLFSPCKARIKGRSCALDAQNSTR